MQEVKKLNVEIVCFAKTETYYLIISRKGRFSKKVTEKMIQVWESLAEEYSQLFDIQIQIR